ncbi:hypothetical protein CsSME_00004902 [Camellia sinensis var. sinensis]
MEAWRGFRREKLVENFYSSSCPNVESIVHHAVSTKLSQTFATIPATLRLFFHDCFAEVFQVQLPVIGVPKKHADYLCRGQLMDENSCSKSWHNIFGYITAKFMLYHSNRRQSCIGCDTSIMIASLNGDAERDAQDNLSLAGDGFDTDQGKTSSRSSMPRCRIITYPQNTNSKTSDPGGHACPHCRRHIETLHRHSCPAGGPSFSVELGRRDRRISLASCVAGNLAKPFFDLTQLNAIFVKNNLTQFDMIALSGAHTVGVSHCNNVENRLYSFSPSSPVDPYLDPNHAQQLMQACPQNIGPTIVINVDPVTPGTFDNVYYQNLIARKGLFTSDQVLFTNPTSRPTVNDFANNPNEFN